MKKLLYITVNSKPEELSASKTVGRAMVNALLNKYKDMEFEEIDLYDTHLPRLQYDYFKRRNCMIDEEAMKDLEPKEREEVQKITKLVDQFKEADFYILATPMWSLSFPAPLKEYLDCIIMDEKTIKIDENHIEGLLKDKPRKMIYIQSSGAKINMINGVFLNKGMHYVESMMKMMGIEEIEEYFVDGTGFTKEEQQEAIQRALDNIDEFIYNI